MTSLNRRERPSAAAGDDGELDLQQLAHAVWRYRVAIILCAVFAGAAGIAASVLLTTRESHGLFLTPDVPVDAYKRYEASFGNRQRLEEFLETSGNADSSAVGPMRAALDTGSFGRLVRPVFAFTDKDAKTYGVKVDDANKLVGIELSVTRAVEEGDAPVLVLAEYVRDVIIKTDMQEFTLAQCLANQTRDKELRNAQIADEFQRDQERLRAENLRGIIASTPGAGSISGLQTVSLEDGTQRFLSPAAQLVAAEIKISDLDIAQKERDRMRVASALREHYYCAASALLAERVSGREFLARLASLRSAALAASDMQDTAVEEVANALEIQSQRWNNQYIEHMRFVTSPQGAEVNERKFGRILGALVGGAFGLIFGIVLALVLSWWRQNRDAIQSPD